jgi:hypothetical protein
MCRASLFVLGLVVALTVLALSRLDARPARGVASSSREGVRCRVGRTGLPRHMSRGTRTLACGAMWLRGVVRPSPPLHNACLAIERSRPGRAAARPTRSTALARRGCSEPPCVSSPRRTAISAMPSHAERGQGHADSRLRRREAPDERGGRSAVPRRCTDSGSMADRRQAHLSPHAQRPRVVPKARRPHGRRSSADIASPARSLIRQPSGSLPDSSGHFVRSPDISRQRAFAVARDRSGPIYEY